MVVVTVMPTATLADWALGRLLLSRFWRKANAKSTRVGSRHCDSAERSLARSWDGKGDHQRRILKKIRAQCCSTALENGPTGMSLFFSFFFFFFFFFSFFGRAFLLGGLLNCVVCCQCGCRAVLRRIITEFEIDGYFLGK